MAFAGYLKQSTAVDVLIGPFVDEDDGKTAEAGAAPDVELSKNGQALANKNDATVPTHDAAGDVDGYYNCELDATDTNTLGILTLVVHTAGTALPVRHDYQVVSAHWWDTMCGSDYLNVDAIQIEGGDATDAINAACDTALTDYDAPTNAEMEARTLVAASYFDPAADTVANVTTVATLTGHTAQTGDNFARLGAPAGASVSADIADVPTVAEMNARTIAAASYFDPAVDAVANVTLCATTTTNTDMRGTDNAALASVCTEARLAELAAANLPTDVANVKAETALIVADTNELQTDWANAGRLDAILDARAAEATVAALNDVSSADVTAACTSSLNTYDPPTNAEMEARTLVAASYFDPAVDAVASVTLCDTTTTNTDMVGTDSAALASVCTEARLAELDAANLPADISGLNDLSAADVNAEVVDALTVDVIADSVSADGTRPTIAQALLEINRFLQERAVSSTTVTVKKEDGSTSAMTFTLDSDTTPTSITRAS